MLSHHYRNICIVAICSGACWTLPVQWHWLNCLPHGLLVRIERREVNFFRFEISCEIKLRFSIRLLKRKYGNFVKWLLDGNSASMIVDFSLLTISMRMATVDGWAPPVTLSECCHIQYGRLVWQSFTVTEFCNSRPITGTDTSSFRVKCAKIPESKRTKFHSFHSKQLEFSCRLALFNYTSATRTIIQTESWRIVFDLTWIKRKYSRKINLKLDMHNRRRCVNTIIIELRWMLLPVRQCNISEITYISLNDSLKYWKQVDKWTIPEWHAYTVLAVDVEASDTATASLNRLNNRFESNRRIFAEWFMAILNNNILIKYSRRPFVNMTLTTFTVIGPLFEHGVFDRRPVSCQTSEMRPAINWRSHHFWAIRC